MLEVQHVRRAFGARDVLRGINLTISEGELLCLLGPSGCGKTTLLRIIAGLEQADQGDICLDGQSILHIPVHQRGFGLMFQDFALFPHLDVADNIGFGMKMHGYQTKERQLRIGQMLKQVGLEDFEKRDVSQLSGGERQRVALARSLALMPRLLMLDEPLGALDEALKSQLVTELRAIIKQVGLTAIYVTHDQREAFAIADRIALMNSGQFEQIDTPEQLYRQPKTAFAAKFLGLDNIIPVTDYCDGRAITPLGTFEMQAESPFLLLHPAGLQLVSADIPDTIPVVIEARVFAGDQYHLTVRHLESQTALMLSASVFTTEVPRVGQTARIHALPSTIIALEK